MEHILLICLFFCYAFYRIMLIECTWTSVVKYRMMPHFSAKHLDILQEVILRITFRVWRYTLQTMLKCSAKIVIRVHTMNRVDQMCLGFVQCPWVTGQIHKAIHSQGFLVNVKFSCYNLNDYLCWTACILMYESSVWTALQRWSLFLWDVLCNLWRVKTTGEIFVTILF